MKLKELIPTAPVHLGEQEITSLAQDSRQAGPGVLFFAIEGTHRDGHDFLGDVLVKGAVAAVVQRGHRRLEGLERAARERLIEVEDSRIAIGECASFFNDHPSYGMTICGVTGTNGKTTSTYLLEALLTAAGQSPAVIGTVENRFRHYRTEASHTTPDALNLQSMLANFRAKGATAACLEVSSHALDQKRVAGTRFAATLFTNLTQDHLDYHSSMEEYFRAKSRLFFDYPVDVRAIHADDVYGARLAESCAKRGLDAVTFGRKGQNVSYENLFLSATGIEGELSVAWKGLRCTIPVRSRLIGGFNAKNLAGVAAVGIGLGIAPATIGEALSQAKAVPGRMEAVPNSRGLTVVVDYAHTPDALEKALKTLRFLSSKRVICVFGCGGDRDPTKRPIMGALAEELSDLVFITSDNPRTEDPAAIIDEIVKGTKSSEKIRRIEDRRAAIAMAISILKPGDILLIAGKGHEDYQIIGTRKLPFDDRKVALENLS